MPTGEYQHGRYWHRKEGSYRDPLPPYEERKESYHIGSPVRPMEVIHAVYQYWDCRVVALAAGTVSVIDEPQLKERKAVMLINPGIPGSAIWVGPTSSVKVGSAGIPVIGGASPTVLYLSERSRLYAISSSVASISVVQFS